MKVTIVNKSDQVGGAAVVSLRLMHALRDAGVDARLLALSGSVDDKSVGFYGSKWIDKFNFLAERLNIFFHNHYSRKNLFKVSTALWGRDIAEHPWIKDADVIALNWINQGALSLKGIEHLCALGKPVIWTMHDMWCCTGICHHAYECDSYSTGCGCCQFLQSNRSYDLSTKVQSLKKDIYLNNKIHFVAVSNWLAKRCSDSSLMQNQDVSVIHNAFPIEQFSCERSDDDSIGVPKDKIVIVMGAARLDDDVKGFNFVIEMSRKIVANHPELADKLHIVLFGNIRNQQLLDEIAIGHTFLGHVSGADAVANVYRHADIVLSTSLYETLPGTLIEGMACGCTPVTFGNGGQADIVDHLQTGFIADYKNAESLADGIAWAASQHLSREMLHEEVRRKFSAQTIAEKYLELFRKLI
ncbi:MAG: glycosyltransferase [Muribaculaceae bacterium]|jgi:glycosyltransferase involved in cell wall biosynthesis|nr:glycosyltransferase [Muribaculaceae bacterium]